jgi:hypothetical protein
MGLRPPSFADREIEHRQEDVDNLVGNQQAPQYRRRHRANDFGSDPPGPEHGGDRQDRSPLGQELATEPVDRSLQNRLPELMEGVIMEGVKGVRSDPFETARLKRSIPTRRA